MLPKASSSLSIHHHHIAMAEPPPRPQAQVPPAPPCPPPPPPPPLPPLSCLVQCSQSSSDSGRLRSVCWERIPRERVEGKRSVWTKSDEFAIDLSSLDELFGQRRCRQVKALRVRGHRDGDKPSQMSSAQHSALRRVSIMEGRRSLKVGIFLHHFRSSLGEIINDVREGRGQRYGSEKLNELYKLLPDSDEEQRLRAFRGDRDKLEETDLFMLHLVEVSSFRLRLEAMILQEDFYPALTSLSASARCLATAATELLSCVELHSILRLVLRAGNYMNGRSSYTAAGFRISSLLQLTETKSNRPGMTLLHFVALEAVKKDPSILSYHLKLGHVGPAARLSVESVQEEFTELQSRVTALLEPVKTEPDLHALITPFLQAAEMKLAELQVEVSAVWEVQRTLLEFFCEDDDGTFKLDEACATFHIFQQRFLRAAQENVLWEQQHQRRLQREQKRASIASCSALEAGPNYEKDALEIILEMDRPIRRNLCSTWGRRTLKRGVSSQQKPSLHSLLEKEHSGNTENKVEKCAEVPDNGASKDHPEVIQTTADAAAPSADCFGHSHKANSTKTSTLPPCLHPKTQALITRETDTTVHSLASSSSLPLTSILSLALPTEEKVMLGQEEMEMNQEVVERIEKTQETKQETRLILPSQEQESATVAKPQKGNSKEWIMNDSYTIGQDQSATAPPRPSCLPLDQSGSTGSDPPLLHGQSKSTDTASVKERPVTAEQAKRPHPLKWLLDKMKFTRKEKGKKLNVKETKKTE